MNEWPRGIFKIVGSWLSDEAHRTHQWASSLKVQPKQKESFFSICRHLNGQNFLVGSWLSQSRITRCSQQVLLVLPLCNGLQEMQSTIQTPELLAFKGTVEVQWGKFEKEKKKRLASFSYYTSWLMKQMNVSLQSNESKSRYRGPNSQKSPNFSEAGTDPGD